MWLLALRGHPKHHKYVQHSEASAGTVVDSGHINHTIALVVE